MAKVHENKQAIIGIVFAIILILGAGIVFAKAQKSPEKMSDENVKLNSNNPKVQDIMSVLKSGKNLQCNFEHFENEDTSTSGVVYINGENIRFDATTYVDGADNDIFMIRKSDSNYIWGTQFPKNTGLMMESTLDQFFSNPQASQYLNADKYKYSCKDWKVDSTAFDLPSNIKFTDLLGVMRSMISGSR